MNNLEYSKKEKTEELNNNIKELEKVYQTKKDELNQEYEQYAKKLKIERDRELEEYNYKTKREREISNNKWEDEKKEREINLAKKESELNKLLDEASENAEHLKELEDKVKDIPDLLEKEYNRGKKEITEELKKEHNYEIELLKKDFQNTIDRQNDKILALQEIVKKSDEEKNSLQNKLDQAYNQIKEMATKTVEATGGVKILGNNANENK